jgi:hypothetical protein
MVLINITKVKGTYDSLCQKLKQRCKTSKAPNLLNITKTKYTIQGLAFVFFGQNMGQVMHKRDLISFLKRHGCHTVDPQPRHLGMQFGLDFLVMRSYHAKLKRALKAGEYCLRSLTTTHPKPFASEHRCSHVTKQAFARLKKHYAHRCSCCGSKEHESNFKNPKIITVIEKGHKDPRKPLTVGNCIPLCTMCNHVYKNNVVFTERGFVKFLS